MFGIFGRFEGTKLLWGAVLVNCICGGMSHWFHNIVLNVMEDVIKDYLQNGFVKTHSLSLDESTLSYVYSICIVSIWSLGAVFGAAIAHSIVERISRRNSLMIFLNVVNLSAGVMCLIAQWSYIPEFLMLGRFTFGVGSGFYDVVIGLFMTEIAPTSVRGLAPCITLIPGILNGMFLMVLGLPNFLGKPHMWAYVIMIGAAPCIIPLCCYWKFPKSPKFLYIKLGLKEEARQVVIQYQGQDADIDGILEHFEKEEKLAGHQVGLRTIWRTKHLRIPFLIVLIINISQNTAGIDTVTNYSTTTFETLGITGYSAMIASILIQIPLLIGVIFMLALLERKGRRLLHLGGLGFGFLGVLLIFASELTTDYGGDSVNTYVAGVFCIIGAAFVYFGFGFGPCMIPFFIFGEITPLAARSTTASFCVSVNWFCSVLYDAFYYILEDYMGGWVQLFMVVPTLLIIIYLYRNMPESKGLTVDEVVSQWLDEPDRCLLDEEGSENLVLTAGTPKKDYDTMKKVF